MTPKPLESGRLEHEKTRRVGASRRQAAAIALASALRPIVDACLELGVTSPEMERLLRGVFVECAAQTLARARGSGKRPSDLRIGLMIGVHRNFVREIRGTKPSIRLRQVQPRHRADALLQEWATDWRYLTPAGLPRDLPIQAPKEEPSFTSLTNRHMPGVTAKTAIAELRRCGAIQLLPDEQVRLRSRTVRLSGVTDASMSDAGTRLSHFANTLLHNVRHPERRRFCESTETGGLEQGRLPLVQQTIARRAQSFLDGLSEELSGESEPKTGESAGSLGVTVFCYELEKSSPAALLKRRRSNKP